MNPADTMCSNQSEYSEVPADAHTLELLTEVFNNYALFQESELTPAGVPDIDTPPLPLNVNTAIEECPALESPPEAPPEEPSHFEFPIQQVLDTVPVSTGLASIGEFDVPLLHLDVSTHIEEHPTLESPPEAPPEP